MKKYLIYLTTVLILAGCQGDLDSESNPIKENYSTEVQKEETMDKGIPYSNGPSSMPEESIGPSAPPPTGIVEAQAITTNENIRITLPRKTE